MTDESAASRRWQAVKSGLWNVHEKVVYLMLGIVSTLERPAYSVLSNELNRVKREYGIDITKMFHTLFNTKQ